MPKYTLDPESNIPVYRQLADQINAQIRSGALRPGEKLPTVRELADQLNLSCGTVKRVYDHLREHGDVEMTRRRGTFVRAVHDEGDSRKLAGMTAIDQMLRTLSQLHFSPAEIQIFLNLKMREWGVKWFGISAAMVMPCEDVAAAMERQVTGIGNVRMIACTAAQVREYPYSVDEQADVILASQEGARAIAGVLPDAGKLVRVAFAAPPQCVGEIACAGDGPIAVACLDAAFAGIVADCLPAALRGRVVACAGDAPIPEDAVVVATGGMARMIAEQTKTIDHIDGLLTLKGLRLIYEKNQGKAS